MCDTWHCQCHVALLVPRDSVTIKCHCVDFYLVPFVSFCFNLVPTYMYLIQFCPNLFNK